MNDLKKDITMNQRQLTTLLLYAFRYAIERNTGVSYEMSSILMCHKDELPEWAKHQIVRDIINNKNKFREFDYDNWMSLAKSFSV